MEKKILKEFIKLFDKAPKLKANGLRADYKKLLEYDGIVLAAKRYQLRTHENEFEFVTWHRSTDNGVCWGHYITDYNTAKEDFAKRCGLIPRGRMFDESELLLIHSGLVKVGTFPDLDHATRKGIGQIVEKIEGLEIEALKEFLYEDELGETDNSMELEP